MLGAAGIRERIEAGQIVIDAFDEDQLRPGGYDLTLASAVVRLEGTDRPLNPLNADHLETAFRNVAENTGEIEIPPETPVAVRTRERVAVADDVLVRVDAHPDLAKLGLRAVGDTDALATATSEPGAHRVTCTLTTVGSQPVILHPGQPVVRLRFTALDGANPDVKPVGNVTDPRPAFADLPATIAPPGLCIGVTGLAATGKSETAEILADLFDARAHPMGQVIRDEVAERGLAETGENMNAVSKDLRDEHGHGVVAERLVDRLETDTTPGVRIIEGVRGPAEVEVFRRELTDTFVLVGVHASRETRVARLAERGRPDDAGGAAVLAARDDKESGFGVREALGMCDHIITNEGSLADLERAVEQVAARICAPVE